MADRSEVEVIRGVLMAAMGSPFYSHDVWDEAHAALDNLAARLASLEAERDA